MLRIHVYEPVNKFQKCGYIYSRTPVTRTQKGNENQFRELATIQVIGVDWKIQYAMLEIDIYWFRSTSV